MNDQTKESQFSRLLQLRLLVGYLGERAQFGWWPTAFFEPASKLFLEPVFSKTARLAQYHGIVEAARRLHDEHLNVGSYHLFRFPEEVEQDLHLMAQSSYVEEFVADALRDKDAALGRLNDISTSSPVTAGPKAIGSIQDLNSPDALAKLAGGYAGAFANNIRMYPYLLGEA